MRLSLEHRSYAMMSDLDVFQELAINTIRKMSEQDLKTLFNTYRCS